MTRHQTVTTLAFAFGLLCNSATHADERTPLDATDTLVNAPGSYYLTENIDNGITVQADDVSIDFNGFSVTGGADCRTGIQVRSRNLTVRNGGIRGCGIGILVLKAGNLEISDMRFDSLGTGIQINEAEDMVVRDSLFLQRNGEGGGNFAIVADSAANLRLHDNLIQGRHYGLLLNGVDSRVDLENNLIVGATAGLVGIGNLTARHNLMIAGPSSASQAVFDGRKGIEFDGNARIEANIVSGYPASGILVSRDSQVLYNLIRGNGLSSLGDGIEVTNNTLVKGNVARANGAEGIRVALDGVLFGDHALVMHNVATSNGLGGPGFANLRCGDNCMAKNNVDW
jgi:hypothetical protein